MTKWNTLGLRSWLLGVVAVAAMGAGFAGAQFRHVDIVVQGPTGRRNFSIWTFGTKVKGILHQAGVRFGRHDTISPQRTISAGEPIVVQQAIPVEIQTPHRDIRIWTTRYNVGAVLSAANVKLGPLDEVSPAQNTRITTSTKINVTRRWWVTKHIAEKIPFAVRHKPDSALTKGRTLIRVKGHDGKRIKTIRQLLQNGKVVKTIVVNIRTVTRSIPEVIDFGVAHPISRGGPVLQFSQSLRVVATAYWPDPAWSNGYTATGVKAQRGVVAVDPRVIPLGTHLYIPGYGFAVAEDVGGGIVGDHIDLCYDTGQQAINWGVRYVTVYILRS